MTPPNDDDYSISQEEITEESRPLVRVELELPKSVDLRLIINGVEVVLEEYTSRRVSIYG
jgi:hypothetical protein